MGHWCDSPAERILSLKAKLNSSFQLFFQLFCQIIRQNPQAIAREILASSFNAFNVFLGDRAPEDDITLVVIKITKD
jgi:serine phosphatase RsbU (regulator of sigma subunit)